MLRNEDFESTARFGQLSRKPDTVEPLHAMPVLDEVALHGLAGDVARTIFQYSEANMAALLSNFLVLYGNCLGAGPHVRVEHTTHPFRLFAVLVGISGTARKGTSLSALKYLFRLVDESWAAECITGGLSSGEGLVYHVRDPVYTLDNKGERKVADPGVDDKRLLLVEEEFSSTLKMAERQGNIVSEIIRRAFDTGNLATLTKNSPTRATGAHISILAHITQTELLQRLSQVEQANGYANRFLWLMVGRSKFIARPKGVPGPELDRLAWRLQESFNQARRLTEIDFDDETLAVWEDLYPALSNAGDGLGGALCNRADLHTLKLAGLYAVIDGSAVIQLPHLRAALGLWEYVAASTKCIFGDALGDPIQDTIYAALQQHPAGLTRTEIAALFAKHVKSDVIERGLTFLRHVGRVRQETHPTSGRPTEHWYAEEAE